MSELSGLKASDLHLDEKRPYIEIRASEAKDAKTAEIAIRHDLALKLKDWVSGKLPGARVFKVPKGLRKILYRDLDLAGIQKLDDKGRPVADDQGRKIDVHALRATCGTELARHGVLPQVASKHMRHSTLDMTMKHYTHLALEDKSKAVERLPVYDSGHGSASQKMTGTDDSPVDWYAQKYAQHQSFGDISSQTNETTGKLQSNSLDSKTGVSGTSDKSCHLMRKCPGLESNQHDPKVTSPSS